MSDKTVTTCEDCGGHYLAAPSDAEMEKLAEETAKKFFAAIYAGATNKKPVSETAQEMENVILTALQSVKGGGR